ncbi:MAG: alpha/beta fold hydrolase [Pseudomonadales bacterium]
MRIVLGIFGTALVLIVGAALLLWVSARSSLDGDFEHTRRTTAFPILVSGDASGLVQVSARAMMFRARLTGLEREGPALVLLHGFPKTSMMWEPLISEAEAAGFRVVAFDQRGYSPGARPITVESYGIEEMTADLFAVADAVGFERFHLVAHD